MAWAFIFTIFITSPMYKGENTQSQPLKSILLGFLELKNMDSMCKWTTFKFTTLTGNLGGGKQCTEMWTEETKYKETKKHTKW